MLFLFWIVYAGISVLFFESMVTALPDGCPTCNVGSAAPQSLHLFNPITGPISTGQFQVKIDGAVVTESPILRIAPDTDFPLVVSSTAGTQFRGILVVLNKDGVSLLNRLVATSNSYKAQSDCPDYGRSGFTHVDNEFKSSASATIRMPPNLTAYLDVNIVLINRIPEGSIFYYSRFEITTVDPSAPVPIAPPVPITPPVPEPVPTPVTLPVAPPVPMSLPVPEPIPTPITPPVDPPVPMSLPVPVPTPVTPPVAPPVPITPPISDPVPTPVTPPVTPPAPITPPVPVMNPVPQPVPAAPPVPVAVPVQVPIPVSPPIPVAVPAPVPFMGPVPTCRPPVPTNPQVPFMVQTPTACGPLPTTRPLPTAAPESSLPTAAPERRRCGPFDIFGWRDFGPNCERCGLLGLGIFCNMW